MSTSTAIRYTTGKTYEFGRQPVTFYTATLDDLRVNIDRDPSTDYLAWSIFITRTTGAVVENVYTNYRHTLRDAKAVVAAYVAADVILKRAL